jgi:hypothetical protein
LNGKLALFLLAPVFGVLLGLTTAVDWRVALAVGIPAAIAFGYCIWHITRCWDEVERENRQLRRALERMNQSFRMRPTSGTERDVEDTLRMALSNSLPASLDYRVTRVKSGDRTKFEVEVIAG